MIRRIITFTISLLSASALAQVEIADTHRYLDLATYTLNEPCLEYSGVQYQAELVLEFRNGNYYLVILSAAEISDILENCIPLTTSISGTTAFYNIDDLIIADGNADTGARYDLRSAILFDDLSGGFEITKLIELREYGSILEITGDTVVTIDGPTELPFVYDGSSDIWLGLSKDFEGSIEYDFSANKLHIQVSNTNSTGSYQFSVRYNAPSLGLIDVRVQYYVNFTVP